MKKALQMLKTHRWKAVVAIACTVVAMLIIAFAAFCFYVDRYRYQTADKAVSGKADRLYMVSDSGEYHYVISDRNAGADYDYMGKMSREIPLHYSCASDDGDMITEELENAFPGLTDRNRQLHKDRNEGYGKIYSADPRFLRDTGVQLADGLDWEEIISLIPAETELIDRYMDFVEGRTEEMMTFRTYLILGSEYQNIKPGTKLIEEGDLEKHSAAEEYTVLGHFKPGQSTVCGGQIQYCSSGFDFSVDLDREIVVLEIPFISEVFFADADPENVKTEIAELATKLGIPADAFTVMSFPEAYRENRVFNWDAMKETPVYVGSDGSTVLPALAVFALVLGGVLLLAAGCLIVSAFLYGKPPESERNAVKGWILTGMQKQELLLVTVLHFGIRLCLTLIVFAFARNAFTMVFCFLADDGTTASELSRAFHAGHCAAPAVFAAIVVAFVQVLLKMRSLREVCAPFYEGRIPDKDGR